MANLKPVLLAGTTVKRASLHNADIISKLDVRIGDTVFVEKGGEIIPKIIGVDLEKRPEHSVKVEFIANCPECQIPLVRTEGEAAYYCPNEGGCPPQIKGKLEHFIGRRAMDIDSLGEGKIELLYENQLLRNVADLYDLTHQDIFGLEKTFPAEEGKREKKISFKEKTTENILKGIDTSQSVPFQRVLFALGIRFVGETVAKKLVEHFENIGRLMQADFEELISVNEIGEKIAGSILEYFKNDDNRTLVGRLENAGLQFQVEDRQSEKENKLDNKAFVVSGTFSRFSRDELKAAIEKFGGRNASAISSKTDFVIAGENMGPSKLEKANKLEIPIISEDDFIEMIH